MGVNLFVSCSLYFYYNYNQLVAVFIHYFLVSIIMRRLSYFYDYWKFVSNQTSRNEILMPCQFAQGNIDMDSLVLKELSKLTAN